MADSGSFQGVKDDCRYSGGGGGRRWWKEVRVGMTELSRGEGSVQERGQGELLKDRWPDQ